MAKWKGSSIFEIAVELSSIIYLIKILLPKAKQSREEIEIPATKMVDLFIKYQNSGPKNFQR